MCVETDAGHQQESAVAEYPDVFPGIFSPMIKAGERAGRLPAILAGDLNAVPGSPPLRRLAQKGWYFTDLGKPRFTIGTPKPDRQIDYVLVRPVANWNVVGLEVMDEPVASDHLPVVLQLEWVASKR